MTPPLSAAASPLVEGPVVVIVLDGVGLGDGGPADAVALARLCLMQWLSPAFPTGAYAYSQGLEQAMAEGLGALIKDMQTRKGRLEHSGERIRQLRPSLDVERNQALQAFVLSILSKKGESQ
jgi:hypothetical protein